MEASALRRQRAALRPRSRRLLGALGDDHLVDQVRAGNDAAFEVIFDRHYRGILSFCRHMLGSREEAEDAVQQTFASAYTDLQSNEREIRLKAWLYTIARNRCLSILRARREQATDLEDEPIPTAGLSEQVQQRADLQELLADLRELPEGQREALVLFEIGDLSQAEVANVIGVEPMKVKALVYQARTALIENRDARAIPCTEIREQLATATGGALRRGPLRRHLRACEGCREYAGQVKAQRRALAALLPVVPSVGFKNAVLSAIGFGGGAGGGGIAAGGGVATGAATSGAAAGGSGATGLLATFGGGAGAAKLAAAAVLGGGALIGGGVAVEHAVTQNTGSPESAQAAEPASGQSSQGGSAQGSGGPSGTSPALITNSGDSGTGRSDQGKKDERGKKDDRKSDGTKSHGGNGSGAGNGNGSNGSGAANGRGESRSNSNPGSTRRGGTRGNGRGRGNGSKNGNGNSGGTHGNSGTKGNSGNAGNPPPPPAHPPPGANGNAGNGGGRGTTSTTPATPPAQANNGNSGNKTDEAKKLVSALPVPLPQ